MGLLNPAVDVKFDFVRIRVIFTTWQQSGRYGTFSVVKPLETHNHLKSKFDSHRPSYPGYLKQIGYYAVSPFNKCEIKEAEKKKMMIDENVVVAEVKVSVPPFDEIITISDSDDNMM